jgi:hypothetical protein
MTEEYIKWLKSNHFIARVEYTRDGGGGEIFLHFTGSFWADVPGTGQFAMERITPEYMWMNGYALTGVHPLD